MVSQSSLWQVEQQNTEFSELCNALYERELTILGQGNYQVVKQLQARILSLPYYVKHTADAMLNTESPLNLDIQNASWSAKQAAKMPALSQHIDYSVTVLSWYNKLELELGLVIPIALPDRIVLDSIDRIDKTHARLRTNAHGWFDLVNELPTNELLCQKTLLLKPTKKIMIAACSGHSWSNQRKINPVLPSLRELLLSCSINWQNFKQPKVNVCRQ